MKFDWESKTLYKGESKRPTLWVAALIGLTLFGLWFTFGGSHHLLSFLMRYLGV